MNDPTEATRHLAPLKILAGHDLTTIGYVTVEGQQVFLNFADGVPERWLASCGGDVLQTISTPQGVLVRRARLACLTLPSMVKVCCGNFDTCAEPCVPLARHWREQAKSARPALMLKGIGKINGDGWKDTTKLGEVVYVWNRELGEPYQKGQYPRVGAPVWSASTAQYEFVAGVSDEEAIGVIDRIIEDLRTEVSELRRRLDQALASRAVDFGGMTIVPVSGPAERRILQGLADRNPTAPIPVPAAADDGVVTVSAADEPTRDPHRGGSSYEASMLRDLVAWIHGDGEVDDGGAAVEFLGLDGALESAKMKVRALLAATRPSAGTGSADLVRLERHALPAGDCPPDCQVVLLSSVRRILGHQAPVARNGTLKACASDRDGDCRHAQCPQIRDGEPDKSGRHCPLDGRDES